jgi:hypothetical protein
MAKTMDFNEVVEEINEAFADMSGSELASIAEKYIDAEYTYEGDGIFIKQDDQD